MQSSIIIREQCSNNRCQCREAGLKCTDLRSCNDAVDDGSCDNDADDNDHELSDDQEDEEDDDEEEEEEDKGDE